MSILHHKKNSACDIFLEEIWRAIVVNFLSPHLRANISKLNQKEALSLQSNHSEGSAGNWRPPWKWPHVLNKVLSFNLKP